MHSLTPRELTYLIVAGLLMFTLLTVGVVTHDEPAHDPAAPIVLQAP